MNLYRTILLLKFHSFILFLQIGDILCQAVHFYSGKSRLTLKLNKSYRVWWNIRISFSRRQPQYFILFSLNTSVWELCEHIFIQKYAAFVLTVTGLSFSTWLVISSKKNFSISLPWLPLPFFNQIELNWNEPRESRRTPPRKHICFWLLSMTLQISLELFCIVSLSIARANCCNNVQFFGGGNARARVNH